MNDFAIRAENVGKRYFLGESSGRNYVGQALKALMPGSKVGNLREFWAIRGASFTINKGEAVGIIGRNGAGKSTLLKMLSRVSAPAEGRIQLRGRVGTLLEVGTGFHPELTGRDNIFLSGTILGMSYQEVAQKFDEIVAFSEIGKFIDTPVKRYSSGMYVRLAFAVASFLEPEILIVDEVLAVGDAAFQRKSLGRLNEVSERDGRTVLFVSHNLGAIRTFCKRVLLLDKGQIVFDGPTEEGLERYLKAAPKNVDVSKVGLKGRLDRTNGAVRIKRVSASNQKNETTWQFAQGETVNLAFEYEVMERVPDMTFLMQLLSAMDGQIITTIRKEVSASPLNPGECGKIELTLPNIQLRPTELSLLACVGRGDDVVYYDVVDHHADLPLLAINSPSEDKYERQGIVSLPADMRVTAEVMTRP